MKGQQMEFRKTTLFALSALASLCGSKGPVGHLHSKAYGWQVIQPGLLIDGQVQIVTYIWGQYEQF